MLEVGKYYRLKVNLFGRRELYEGRVLSIGGNEFRFETEDDNCCRALTLRFRDVVFSEEFVPEKKERVFSISNKKKFTNLKKSDTPIF